jgi:hypothetical protein
MPSKNPKHNRMLNTKSPTYVREYKHQRITKKTVVTLVIIAVVGLGSIGLLTVLFGEQNSGIARAEVGDTVSLTYWLWTSNAEGAKVLFKETNTFSITLGDSEKTSSPSVIYGFYQMVLGMYNGTFDEEWMPGCIDANADGWDDRYAVGEVKCYTYGSGTMMNTPLIYKIQVNNIVKG